MSKISVDKDGVDYINVYSKGKTHLGRLLSNFSYSPITTEDGDFISIEGYWYWLLTEHAHKDQLRSKFGNEAKELGRQLSGNNWSPIEDSHVFESKIITALRIKIQNSEDIKMLLKKNQLPFVHYYVYGSKTKAVSGCEWFLSVFEQIGQDLKINNT